MRPRTKLQKIVSESFPKLSDLTYKEEKEIFEKTSAHLFRVEVSKNKAYCFDCGHSWQWDRTDTSVKTVCPHCGRKLLRDISKRQNFTFREILAKAEVFENFQVIRFFEAQVDCIKGKNALMYYSEVAQRWMTEEGKEVVVGKVLAMWSSRFCWGSPLEIRNDDWQFQFRSVPVIGKVKVIPKLKRNGFRQGFHGMGIQDVFRLLLNNNHFETLWKTGRYHIAASYTPELSDYWRQLSIAHKHNYKITDVSMWMDILRNLKRFGKDLNNPKYICPENLVVAHDYWVDRVKKADERERLQRERERFMAEAQKATQLEEAYKARLGKLLELEFKDGEISVTPLKSIMEFVEEGVRQHHCVYANKYYEKKDTLIMHAFTEDELLATIEFNLSEMKILQCRSKCNGTPKHKERIENLINNNIGRIAKCLNKVAEVA